MTTRTSAHAVVIALLSMLPLIGCGSGYSSSGPAVSTPDSTGMRQQTSAATVKTASVSDLGTILVDGQGRTIYLFQRDTGPMSTCTGACLANWPAVTTRGAPQGTGGVAAGKLGVTKRGDGTTQATYAGHPLYYYAGDSASGDTNGQGLSAFGAAWYVMSPSGTAITIRASSGGGIPSGGY